MLTVIGKLEKYKFLDHVFWIVFILFTNPAGILEAMGLGMSEQGGSIHFTDILFMILLGCLFLVHDDKVVFSDQYFSKLVKYLLIFTAYYLLVFGFFIPVFKETPGYAPMVAMVKMRSGIYNIILVFMIYQFYLRSSKLFIKYFLFTSLISMGLFMITITTGMDIMPVLMMERGYVDIKRLIMISDGLLPLLIPMGIVLFVFDFKVRYKYLILINAVLMYILWVFSLIRREIFGAMILFFLIAAFKNYLTHKPIIPAKKTASIFIYFLMILLLLQLTFPEYLEAGIDSAQETYHVIRYGETSTGIKDVRMGMGKGFMQGVIKENFLFGTGFDNRWRTGEGDSQGFEASDYPFLAAIAMTGVAGILFFLPIYIVLIKVMLIDIKFTRSNNLSHFNFDLFMILVFISIHLFQFLQYFNWFLPLSLFAHSGQKHWYIFLAMYFASRRIFYTDIYLKKNEKFIV